MLYYFQVYCKVIQLYTLMYPGFPGGSVAQLVKNLLAVQETACQCRTPGFDPWVGKIPWRREWQPTPVSFPGEFHGQRSLAGYSP